MARKIFTTLASIYILRAPLSGGSDGSEQFAILAKGRYFFRPSAKGLRSYRSLNLLQRNKLILRRATVGGLPLPKVLKNLTNHMFQHDIDYYSELRLQDGSFLPWQKAYDVKM